MIEGSSVNLVSWNVLWVPFAAEGHAEDCRPCQREGTGASPVGGSRALLLDLTNCRFVLH